MTCREFYKYWKPAKEVVWGVYPYIQGSTPRREHPSFRLASLVGVNYPDLGDWAKINLTDRLISVLEAIAGPHGPTIIKALEARKEAKDASGESVVP